MKSAKFPTSIPLYEKNLKHLDLYQNIPNYPPSSHQMAIQEYFPHRHQDDSEICKEVNEEAGILNEIKHYVALMSVVLWMLMCYYRMQIFV